MPAVAAAAPADVFAGILHHLVRRGGGPGNLGQLVCPFDGGVLDRSALAEAWRAFASSAPLITARWHSGLRGPRWVLAQRDAPPLQHADCRDALAAAMVAEGGDVGPLRLGVAEGDRPGLVCTWDHRLCDARGALGCLGHILDGSTLPKLSGWGDDRWPTGLPRLRRELGPMAQAVPTLMKPCKAGHWLPPGAGSGPILPLATGQAVVAGEDLAVMRGAQRAATGRFGESAWQLAAIAAAAAAVAGASGRMLLPLAVDLRGRGESACLANRHGFLFCGVDADLAAHDQAAAATSCQREQKAWMAAGGVEALAAGLAFFPWVPFTLVRRELGFGKPGLGASALPGITGSNELPESCFGARIVGVDHRVVPPASPGLAVLMHRDRRGLVVDVTAAAGVARRVPPQALADAVARALCGSPCTAG